MEEKKIINIQSLIKENQDSAEAELKHQKKQHRVKILKRATALGLDILSILMLNYLFTIAFSVYLADTFHTLNFAQKLYLIENIQHMNLMTTTVIFFSYFTVSYYLLKGQTLGKRLFGLRVLNKSVHQTNCYNESAPTLFQSSVRSFGHFIDYISFGFSIAFPRFRKDAKSISDILAKTDVYTSDELYVIFTQNSAKPISIEDYQQAEEKIAS